MLSKMKHANLAIVIPAFKTSFFRRTMESLYLQTDKRFTVYIGDDCSPSDFKEIISEYSTRLNIVYKRFDYNLGGKDLVAHWERCIDMTKEEEWIWLFSDDDEMDKNCVSSFYQTTEVFPDFDLYHFNVNVINELSQTIELNGNNKFPEIIDSKTFFKKRMSGTLYSYVVEYIFRREHFFKVGRFQNFDLAWGSDNSMWVKLSHSRGIYTIAETCVSWRKSTENISPNYSEEIAKRKLRATISFLNWSSVFFNDHKMDLFIHFIAFKRLRLFYKYVDVPFLKACIDEYVSCFKYKFFLRNFLILSTWRILNK